MTRDLAQLSSGTRSFEAAHPEVWPLLRAARRPGHARGAWIAAAVDV